MCQLGIITLDLIFFCFVSLHFETRALCQYLLLNTKTSKVSICKHYDDVLFSLTLPDQYTGHYIIDILITKTSCNWPSIINTHYLCVHVKVPLREPLQKFYKI